MPKMAKVVVNITVLDLFIEYTADKSGLKVGRYGAVWHTA